MNEITQLDFELASYDMATQQVSHYTMVTLPQYFDNVRDNLAVPDAFAEVVKAMNYTGL